MAKLTTFAAALIAAAALLPIAAISAPSATPTTQGAYTEAQASEGVQLYATRCAMCHGVALEGTYEIPPLKGRFIGNWAHAPVAKLFDYISRAMPQMAPGTLTPDQNAKVVAFLLKENGIALNSATIEPAKK